MNMLMLKVIWKPDIVDILYPVSILQLTDIEKISL